MKKTFMTLLFLTVTMCIFILPACTHSHEYTGTTVEASCTAQGYTTYTCSCGDSYTGDYVEKTEHQYTSKIKPPTCIAEGYTTYTCKCGDSYKDDYVEKLENHQYTPRITPPTCLSEGYTTYICTCGDRYKDDYLPKGDHQYSEEVRDPTCYSIGYTIYTCDVCDHRYSDNVVETIEHDYSSVTTYPTCLGGGYTTYTCYVCEYTYKDNYMDALDHVWEQSGVINTATGLTYNTCSVCKLSDASLPIININIGDETLTTDYIDTLISVYNCKEEYELYDIEAEVKIRGNSTAVHPKKPFRIKFNKKQQMLGLNDNLKAKSWVLLAEYIDKSFTRNYTALTLAQELLGTDGYYSSDFCYVEVYINSEYNGIYLLAEQQQVNDSRVDINEPEDDYTGLDIGYLIELDKRAESEDYYFTINYGSSLKSQDGKTIPVRFFNDLYAIKSDIYSDAQKDYIAKHMQNLYDVIYDAVYNDHANLELNPYKTLDANSDIIEDKTIKTAQECIGRLVDIRSLVDTFLLNEIVLNVDIGWSSFYMSLDMSATGNALLTFEAPWDFDLSLTCHENMLDVLYTCNRHNFYTAYENMNPWLVILAREDWFWDMAEARWAEFRNSSTVEKCCLELEAYSEIMGINFNDNFNLWNEFLDGCNSDAFIACKTQEEASALVVNYLKERIGNLDRILNYTPD